MTLVEKILSRASGKPVRPREKVCAAVDLAVIGAAGGPDSVAEYEKSFGDSSVWDASKVAVSFEYPPLAATAPEASGRIACRQFLKTQGIQKLLDMNSGVWQHVLLEQGLVHPSSVVVGTGSHMSLLGAVGCFASRVTAPDMASALRSGKLWFEAPETVRVTFSGDYSFPTCSMDLALHLVSRVEPGAAGRRAMELYGHAVDRFQIHDALTLAGMVEEAGADIGFVSPSEQVVAFLKSRIGQLPELLAADEDAAYSDSVELDVQGLPPQVACPGSDRIVKPVSEIKGTRVDFAFLGSYANGRFEDLAVAAAVLKAAGKVHPSAQLMIVPATIEVARKCLKAGYYETFLDAGAVVTNPGLNLWAIGPQGIPGKGDVLISSASSESVGGPGKGSCAYLASPATVAASAVKGEIADPGEFLR